MTTKRTWTFALLAVALTVTLASGSAIFAAKGGKPPKDDAAAASLNMFGQTFIS